VTEPKAIEEVRGATPDQESERHRQECMPRAGAGEEDEHPDHRERGERRDEGGRAREEPERDSRVLDVMDRKRPDHVGLLAEREAASDELLRQLVGGERRGRDRAQSHPLRTRRG
jgi:hypothetical protein